MLPDISAQIKQDQDAAMLVIKRVAESLPGFTFVENGDQEDTANGADEV